MIEQLAGLPGNTIGFKMSGKLHDEDYKSFVPLVDAAIAQAGKVRVLAQFHDFHGWDAQALWDDIKFSTTHCTKIDRIALVGETAWEKWMAAVCKPFTMAKIRYFDVAEMDQARAWLAEAQQGDFMDHQDQHHQHHQKEREHKVHEKQQHDQAQEKSGSLPVHPKWLFISGFVLIVIALLVWTFIIW